MIPYEDAAITVILTYWKRDTFEQQMDSIVHQTRRPKKIWVYQNESHIDLSAKRVDHYDIPISFIHSRDHNFKYHGRFTLPLLCDTEYTAIFDDDTVPGLMWLENCLRLAREKHCIVGANGRTILKGYQSIQEGHWQVGVGGPDFPEQDTLVDFVGHSWFFKSEWVRHLWRDRPFSWESGEDIHFAAACKIYGDIDCYVPRMPVDIPALNGDTMVHLGHDQNASWRKGSHQDIRKQVVFYWISKGWKIVDDRD